MNKGNNVNIFIMYNRICKYFVDEVIIVDIFILNMYIGINI